MSKAPVALIVGACSVLLAAAPPGKPGLPLDELGRRLETAWKEGSVDGYLDLWSFPSEAAREEEMAFARTQYRGGEVEVLVRPPSAGSANASEVDLSVQTFTVNEPRAVVEEWRFGLQRQAGGWAIVEREVRSRIDGLMHLSFEPRGFRAEGLTLSFQDFTLRMEKGTVYLPPESLGPTGLIFVGEAQVRFHPPSATEREQLRQFCGSPEFSERVRTAFVRLHPADFNRVLGQSELVADPDALSRFPLAEKVFRTHGTRSYVLDATLPGSPWWLTPALGSSVISFDTSRHGTLTLTVSSDDFESVSLFDRLRRTQICMYPLPGHSTNYNEDDGRAVDVVGHDLQVRFEPYGKKLIAEDTLRMRLLQPAASLRLRLNANLKVHSVTSREGGDHLFFRVRNQDSLMVALGPLSGIVGETLLTVRYSGELAPRPIERDATQIVDTSPEEIPIEEVITYTNRDLWFPEANSDDHAVARLRFDVPRGFLAVSGGVALPPRTDGERTIAEYRQEQPARYFSVCIGRLAEAARREEGGVTIQTFGTPRTRSLTSSALARAVEIIRCYVSWFGAYPFTTLNFVLIEGRTPGGHSPPGMIVLAQRPVFLNISLREDPGSVSPDPSFFLAHELAHQWWGQGVAPQNYHERWLSEGITQYAAALWVRQSQGENSFRDATRRMASWALNRTAAGPISLGNRLGHIKRDPQTYRSLVYDKAALVLHMLRGIVGDEAFRAALIRFQAEKRFSKAGTDDLREALETASGKSLRPYFEEWINGTSLPILRFTHRSENAGPGIHRTEVEVRPQNLPGPVPLEIAVEYAGGREVQRVMLQPAGGTFSITTPGRSRKVTLNGDAGILARIEPR